MASLMLNAERGYPMAGQQWNWRGDLKAGGRKVRLRHWWSNRHRKGRGKRTWRPFWDECRRLNLGGCREWDVTGETRFDGDRPVSAGGSAG